ncbi:MAG: hypothetical protein WCK49_10310, partial [Myxococcaceae bacterium]
MAKRIEGPHEPVRFPDPQPVQSQLQGSKDIHDFPALETFKPKLPRNLSLGIDPEPLQKIETSAKAVESNIHPSKLKFVLTKYLAAMKEANNGSVLTDEINRVNEALVEISKRPRSMTPSSPDKSEANVVPPEPGNSS